MNNSCNIKQYIFLIIAIFVGMAAGFINKFPLTFPDTIGYLSHGFNNILSNDKPHTYSLFLVHVSLKTSLWLPILVQSIIMTYLILQLLKLFQIVDSEYWTLVSITLISFLTGYSFYCSQLMPDIFAAATIIALVLCITKTSISKVNLIFNHVILVLSTMMHVTHVMASLLLLTLLTLGGLIYFKGSLRELNRRFNIATTYLVVLLALLLIPSLHYSISKTFYITKSSHTFFMGRLYENGILKAFLKNECENKNYKLCQYSNDFEGTTGSYFLWDNNSPLYKTDGWEDKDGEYNEIIEKTLTTPKYLSLHIQESIKATAKQLVNFEIGDGLNPRGAELNNFKSYFKYDYKEAFNSDEERNNLVFKFINERQHLTLGLSVIILSSFLYIKSLKNLLTGKEKSTIAIILSGLLINAFVCGTLSGIYWRYQGRVVWLLPLLAILLILSKKDYLFNKIKTFKLINK